MQWSQDFALSLSCLHGIEGTPPSSHLQARPQFRQPPPGGKILLVYVGHFIFIHHLSLFP